MQRPVVVYAVSLASLLIAVVARSLLDPLRGETLALVTLYGPTLVAVWAGGYRPAILVAVLGYLACAYFFIEPRDALGPNQASNFVGFLAYLVTCSVLIGFGEAMRSTQRRFQAQAGTLPALANSDHANMTADAVGNHAHEAQAMLAAIVESSDDAIISKSLEGIIQSWNAGAQRIFKYSPEEAIGRHISFIIPSDRLSEEDEIMRRLRVGERVDHFETVRVRSDGQSIHVSLTVSPLKDETGRIIGASKIARNITEQKRSHQRLVTQYAVVRALADSDTLEGAAPRILQTVCESFDWQVSGLWQVDSHTNILRCSAIWHAPTVDCSRFKAVSLGRTLDKGTELPGQVWASGKSVWIQDVAQDARFPQTLLASEEGLHCASAHPIAINDEVLGVIELYSHETRQPDDELVQLMTAIGTQIAQYIDRMRAEQRLKLSEERFAEFMQHLPGLAWLKDLSGRYVYANDAAERAFRTPRSLLYGRTDEEVFPPDIAAQFRDNDQQALSSASGLQVIELLEHGDGVLHQSIVSKFPIPGPNGRPALVGGMAIDITEHRQAEAALRENEKRLRLLWESAAVLLSTDDPDAMLRQLFAKIGPHLSLDTYLNYMVNEAGDALRLESSAGIPENDVQQIQQLEFGQAICGTVAQNRKPMVVTRIQQSDDPILQFAKRFGIRAYACNPLLAGSRLFGTLSFASRSKDSFDTEEVDFLQTVSHYVTVAYERLRLIQQLQEADRRKDVFLATLAHELRNPLAPLSNMLEVVKHLGLDSEPFLNARLVMERQLAHLVRLVDDLLDVSRINRDKLALRKERIDLASVINQAIETCRPLVEAARHELRVSLPTEPTVLYADPVRLAQVFANLVNNSTKYTEPGGRIWVIAERARDEVVVTVKDNGMGISSDMLPYIFDIFTQASPSHERSQGGLGIGLTLVHRLVAMHDGSIRAFSDGPGRGSEFKVRLPVLAEGSEPEQPASAASPSSQVARRLLIVDDNHDSAASLATLLRLTGHHTYTAHDGIEAIEAAERDKPDVMLLDIGLPKMDGYDVCRAIRQQTWGKKILMIALTGWGQAEDRLKSQQAGFDRHMVKPVDYAALIEVLAATEPTE